MTSASAYVPPPGAARRSSLRAAVAGVDRWLFGRVAVASELGTLRLGLAVILGLRLASWPFAELASTPDGLFRPPPWMAWLSGVGGMPPAGVLVALQVVGVGAALLAIAESWRSGRRSAVLAFRVAWLAFLVLAGCKTSTGKVLHNDVLLLLVSLPVVLCGTPASVRDRRRGPGFGWPLQVALVTAAGVYLLCGVQKLRHSGLAWVFSDNLRWVLDAGMRSGRAPTTAVAELLVANAGVAMAAAGALLALELAFPLVLVWRRARVPFAVGAAGLHTMTWLTLGLDYWAWTLSAALVLGLAARGATVRSAAGR